MSANGGVGHCDSNPCVSLTTHSVKEVTGVLVLPTVAAAANVMVPVSWSHLGMVVAITAADAADGMRTSQSMAADGSISEAAGVGHWVGTLPLGTGGRAGARVVAGAGVARLASALRAEVDEGVAVPSV